jgi:hypothetical protein
MTSRLRITLILGSLARSSFGCSGLSAPLADIESVERTRFAAMTRQDIKALQPTRKSMKKQGRSGPPVNCATWWSKNASEE